MATTKQYLDYTGLQKLVELIKSKFLLKSDATDTYLSKNDASSTYLSKNDASSTYLSKNDASNTYLTQTNASSTYLSKNDASNTYLTKSDATNTYLTDVTVSNNTGLVTRTASTSGAKTIALDFKGLSDKISGIEGSIGGLSNAVHFVGVTTTALTDNSEIKTIKVNNADHTASKGDVVIYGSKEFVFDGSKWHELGDTSAELNAINGLTKDLYGEGGTMASPKDGSFVATVNSDLTTLKNWQDNHVGHAAIPSTGNTGSVEAAWIAAGLTV